MQQNKPLPNNLELDTLLDALNNKEENPAKSKVSADYSSIEIHEYFNFFGITPGRYKVSGKLLYTIYKNWKEDKAMLYQSFTTAVSSYITPLRFKNLVYFGINKKAFKLSEEAIEELNKANFTKKKGSKAFFTRTKHFKSFCTWLGITKGNDPIRGNVIFYFYDYWTYNFKRKTQGPKRLIDFLSKTVKYKRTATDRFLLINKDNLNVTQEELQKAQLWADGYAKKQKGNPKRKTKEEASNN